VIAGDDLSQATRDRKWAEETPTTGARRTSQPLARRVYDVNRLTQARKGFTPTHKFDDRHSSLHNNIASIFA